MKRRDFFKRVVSTCLVIVPGVKIKAEEVKFEFETNPNNTYAGKMTQDEMSKIQQQINKAFGTQEWEDISNNL